MTVTERVAEPDVRPDPGVGSRRPLPEWRVAASVAGLEAPRLGRASLLPLALGVAMVLGSGGGLTDLRAASYNSAFSFLLPAAVALVLSHRAVTRPRRDGLEELFDATPASPRARTAGHLIAVLAPTVLAAGVSVVVVWEVSRGDTTGDLVVAELAVGPVLVAGAGCLGVLLARLWPQSFTPYLACLAIAAAELAVNTPRFAGSGLRWLAFWVEGTLWWALPRPSVAHLVYLLGLVAMAGLGALLLHGVTRRLLATSVAAVVVTAGAAGVQARQPQDHWRRANAMFAQPATVQSCVERDDVRYCMFDRFTDLGDHLSDMVGRVRAVVPATAWPDHLAVTQRVTAADLQYVGDLGRWVPHLADLPDDGRIAQPDDDAIHPAVEFGWSLVQQTGFGVQVAAAVVGLPVVPDDGRVCLAAGQARAVVALWAGAHASDEARRGLAVLVAQVDDAVRSRSGRDADAVLSVAEVDVYGGFAVSLADARLALALLGRQGVAPVIADRWQVFADPATTTAELAAAVGVETAGPALVAQPFLAHPAPGIVAVGEPCR